MAAAALLSSPSTPPIHLRHNKPQFLLLKPTTKTTLRAPASASDNGGATGVLTTQKPNEASAKAAAVEAVAAAVLVEEGVNGVKRFEDERWVNGTWDLKRFQKDGNTDWDSVIDAEARRRKWLENNPEASSNDNPVNFDTSIIPWWAWIKKFHLPEAELLNGRAAMIGFFMAYLVDSLTGVGLVDQTGNFICKTLLFVAVLGVLLIRKNEDVVTLKKLLEESTFYDKQWQATWQDDPTSKSKTDD